MSFLPYTHYTGTTTPHWNKVVSPPVLSTEAQLHTMSRLESHNMKLSYNMMRSKVYWRVIQSLFKWAMLFLEDVCTCVYSHIYF